MVLRNKAKEHLVRLPSAFPGTWILCHYDDFINTNICSLAAVNFCLACVGVVQCTRIFLYERSKAGSTEGAIQKLEGEAKGTVKNMEGEVKKAL